MHKTEYWKYLTWKHVELSYHLIEDLHVYTDVFDKLHEQNVSDNDKEV